MKRAIMILFACAALMIFADARAWNVADYFVSDAERHRSKAELMRDRAGLIDAETRARIQIEQFESDAEFRSYVLNQARATEAAYRQAGAAQGRASLWTGVSILLGIVATALFFLSRKLSERAKDAEATLDEYHRRILEMEHSGTLSADAVYRITTGQRLLTPLR